MQKVLSLISLILIIRGSKDESEPRTRKICSIKSKGGSNKVYKIPIKPSIIPAIDGSNKVFKVPIKPAIIPAMDGSNDLQKVPTKPAIIPAMDGSNDLQKVPTYPVAAINPIMGVSNDLQKIPTNPATSSHSTDTSFKRIHLPEILDGTTLFSKQLLENFVARQSIKEQIRKYDHPGYLCSIANRIASKTANDLIKSFEKKIKKLKLRDTRMFFMNISRKMLFNFFSIETESIFQRYKYFTDENTLIDKNCNVKFHFDSNFQFHRKYLKTFADLFNESFNIEKFQENVNVFLSLIGSELNQGQAEIYIQKFKFTKKDQFKYIYLILLCAFSRHDSLVDTLVNLSQYIETFYIEDSDVKHVFSVLWNQVNLIRYFTTICYSDSMDLKRMYKLLSIFKLAYNLSINKDAMKYAIEVIDKNPYKLLDIIPKLNDKEIQKYFNQKV